MQLNKGTHIAKIIGIGLIITNALFIGVHGYFISDYNSAKGTESRNPTEKPQSVKTNRSRRYADDNNDYDEDHEIKAKGYKYIKYEGEEYIDGEDRNNDDGDIDNDGDISDYEEYEAKGYYVYDYDIEYYQIQEYFIYNTDNCITNDKSIKYCEIDQIEYNHAYYQQYDCYYNYDEKSTFCKFPFKRTRKYVGPRVEVKEKERRRYYDYTNSNYNYGYNYGYDRGYYYLPSHAYRTSSYHNSRECERGYRRVNNYCDKINVPNNGYLTSSGRDWDCEWGYIKKDGYCEEVDVPPYAHYTSNGKSRECDRGYFKRGNYCEEVKVPDNAHLNSNGTTRTCDYGYEKIGNTCQYIYLPANAHLNTNGNNWVCDYGYIQVGEGCIDRDEYYGY